MKYRSTFSLFIIALALGSAYLFYFQPRLEEKKLMEDFEKRFFRADTSDIEFLRLDAGQGPVTITRNGDSWKITKPAEYAPDLGAIKSLFNALAKGRLIKTVGNDEDLHAFGFETVHVILSLGYRGTIDVLKIAGESPSGTGHYAFSERLGKIFLVDKEFVTAMNLKPIDLREKRLFFFQPEEIGRIQLQRMIDSVELERRSDGWHMISPLPIRADSDDMEILIDSLHTQKAEAFLEWKPELANIEKKISLELHDLKGNSLGTYEMYFWGTEWNKGIIAHSPGSKEGLRVGRDFWILLDREYSQFAYRNMINIRRSDALTIRLRTEDTASFEFKKINGQWHSDHTPVPADSMGELIDAINSWKGEKLVSESRDLGNEQFVLEVEYENSTEQVVVSNFNMDYEIWGGTLFAARKGMVKKDKINYLYARSSNLETSAIVSSIDIKNIVDIARGLGNE